MDQAAGDDTFNEELESALYSLSEGTWPEIDPAEVGELLERTPSSTNARDQPRRTPVEGCADRDVSVILGALTSA